MKKIFLPIIGLGAVLFAMGLNLNYAANDYGILENTLSFHITAQASTSGSDNGSGSGSGSDTEKKGSKTREDVETTNVVTVCNRTTHRVTSTPGYNRSCSGEGTLECVDGFVKTGTSTTKTEDCPWYCFM